jgi:hypothetical protein
MIAITIGAAGPVKVKQIMTRTAGPHTYILRNDAAWSVPNIILKGSRMRSRSFNQSTDGKGPYCDI